MKYFSYILILLWFSCTNSKTQNTLIEEIYNKPSEKIDTCFIYDVPNLGIFIQKHTQYYYDQLNIQITHFVCDTVYLDTEYNIKEIYYKYTYKDDYIIFRTTEDRNSLFIDAFSISRSDSIFRIKEMINNILKNTDIKDCNGSILHIVTDGYMNEMFISGSNDKITRITYNTND